MKNIRLSRKLALILLILFIIPNLLIIVFLDTGQKETAELILGCYSITLLILILPISKLLTYIIINKDLKQINKLFHNVKTGTYTGHFTLPTEKPDESEIIRLKRNINWMLHAVATREETLHSILKKEKSSKLLFKEQSYIDGLTRIYNRRYFDENIGKLIHSACLKKCSFALMMIDCDNFKNVNDNFGHQAGDSILTLLGSLLKNIVRKPEDCPFRYGGDEFGLILLGTPPDRLHDIAKNLGEEFIKKNQYNTTLSIGIAECAAEKNSNICPETIKGLADQALYKSKENGRNCITLFHFDN